MGPTEQPIRKLEIDADGNTSVVEMDQIVTEKEVLTQVSRETTWEEVRKLELRERILKSTPTGWINGFGMAAIQIGVPLRYAWFAIKGKEYELLNPEITYKRGSLTLKEGCLSIPDTWFHLKRALEIEYVSDGKRFKAKGLKAQIVQHEVGHMNGELLCANDIESPT